jgi:hypothetical protein
MQDWDVAVKMNKENPANPYGSMYGWENIDIGSFLESAKAWAVDVDVAKKYSNPYTQFAHILLAGKFYE